MEGCGSGPCRLANLPFVLLPAGDPRRWSFLPANPNILRDGCTVQRDQKVSKLSHMSDLSVRYVPFVCPLCVDMSNMPDSCGTVRVCPVMSDLSPILWSRDELRKSDTRMFDLSVSDVSDLSAMRARTANIPDLSGMSGMSDLSP